MCRSLGLRLALAIPIVGEAFRIANAYTYSGDDLAEVQVAPLRLWISRHGWALLASILLTLVAYPPALLFDTAAFVFLADLLPKNASSQSPGALIVSIFPNLLGFGIGVYALIFGLSSAFLADLDKHLRTPTHDGHKPIGSAQLLNADMAYPLLVITLTIGLAIFQQIFTQNSCLTAVTWAALWYALIMTLEILGAIFSLGEYQISERIKK